METKLNASMLGVAAGMASRISADDVKEGKLNDPTREFLDQVAQHGHQTELEKAKGTLRIDLQDGGQTLHWFVRINKGDVTVSRKNGAAACILQAEKSVFDDVVTGRTNSMAAFLRGDLRFEGDLQLMVLFQRLFPASPEPHGLVSQGSRP